MQDLLQEFRTKELHSGGEVLLLKELGLGALTIPLLDGQDCPRNSLIKAEAIAALTPQGKDPASACGWHEDDEQALGLSFLARERKSYHHLHHTTGGREHPCPDG